jgi:hypothetical protein
MRKWQTRNQGGTSDDQDSAVAAEGRVRANILS